VSEPNAFTGVELDRAADGRRRDEAWLAAQREHPAARAVLAGTAGVRVDGDALRLDPYDDRPGAVFLGLDAAGPVFALDEDPPAEAGRRPPFVGAGGRRGEPPPDAAGHLPLREAATVLPAADAGLVAYAAAMLNWHRQARFCSICGTATAPAEGGFTRRCPHCGADHHPRVDPVVIMLVTDTERVLLGRQAAWPERRYSALAGFVGPGESLEEAVAREVEEEAGVAVGPPRYRSSQPWPFPASLMLGFEVAWTGGEPGGRDPELQDVRWFSRDQVAAAAAHEEAWDGDPAHAGELLLPPRTAIARRLVEAWLAETA
jgi:NAD+ diphosphatase